MLQAGARVRDCPADQSPDTTIYNRFNRWSKLGVREDVFQVLTGASGLGGDDGRRSTHTKAHDLVGLGAVLRRVPTPQWLIADRAYDARKLRE
jgi:transposase